MSFECRALGSRSCTLRLRSVPRGRGIGASSPDMRGLPGARMHVGRAAAFGEEIGRAHV